MNTEDMLRELRAQHAQKVTAREVLDRELARLANAITALAGEAPAAPAAPRGPTVPEMVLACYQEFQKRHLSNGLGLVMTNENVLAQAARDFPTSLAKIKRGLSGAQNALLKKNKIKRAMGGWELI